MSEFMLVPVRGPHHNGSGAARYKHSTNKPLTGVLHSIAYWFDGDRVVLRHVGSHYGVLS